MTTNKDPTCRDCIFFDIDSVKNKRGYVMRDWVAQCKWESTEPWPKSINTDLTRRPVPGWVGADSGRGCLCFNPRKKP